MREENCLLGSEWLIENGKGPTTTSHIFYLLTSNSTHHPTSPKIAIIYYIKYNMDFLYKNRNPGRKV